MRTRSSHSIGSTSRESLAGRPAHPTRSALCAEESPSRRQLGRSRWPRGTAWGHQWPGVSGPRTGRTSERQPLDHPRACARARRGSDGARARGRRRDTRPHPAGRWSSPPAPPAPPFGTSSSRPSRPGAARRRRAHAPSSGRTEGRRGSGARIAIPVPAALRTWECTTGTRPSDPRGTRLRAARPPRTRDTGDREALA